MSEPVSGAASKGRRSLWINTAIGLTVSAAFVVLAVRGADGDALERAASTMKVWPILLYFGFLTVGHVMRIARWSLTVRRLAPLRWSTLMAIGAVGMMAVFALPARLGEVVRPVLIARDERVGVGEVMATVVVERLADGLCVSAMMLVTVLALDPAVVDPKYVYSGYAAVAVFGGAAVAMLALGAFFPRIRLPLEQALARVHPGLARKVVATAGGFFGGLRLLAEPRLALTWLVSTVAIWVWSGLGIWVLFAAFPGPVAELGPLAAFATLCVLVVGISIPSAPGTVGVFHWAVAFGVGMFGIAQEEGLVLGTVLHLAVTVCNIGYGLVGWIAGGVRLTDVWRRPSGGGARTDEGHR